MNYQIVDSFAQMARDKGIDKDILVGILEDIFGMMMRKKYGQDAKFDVVVNMEKGDIEIYLEREVVETVENPITQVDVETARKGSGEELEVGDEYVEIIDLESFGRRLVVTAKQTLNQRIKDVEKELIYNEYSAALGEIVVGEIYQIRKKEILVLHNRNELVLPKEEQIFKERYKKGDTLRALVKEVQKGPGNPRVVISRSDPKFLIKLFEIEIPEIYDGIIEIKAVAREAGERSKVAVESHDDRIDAVGACVGMKGVRIHAIVRELNNENIDVINYSEDSTVMITRALAPAKLKSISLDGEHQRATILVANDQASLAIGKNGQNVRLASKLTGFEIDVVNEGAPEEEYDIELQQFRAELGEAIYERLIDEELTTAREVLEAGLEKLTSIDGIGEERAKEILEMMKVGMEEAEVEEEAEEAEESGPAAGIEEEEETKEDREAKRKANALASEGGTPRRP
jgi:transcription termination/antitermination protein NusA